MRNLTNSGIEVVVNTLSGGDAIDITNQNINVDINKAPITTTTAANDQYLLSDVNNNIKKILYSDLIGSSGSGLTAGSALAITGSTINLDISKETAVSSSVDTDIYVLEQADGSIKKITRANLLAGFINTNWTLNSGILYPLDTNTDVVIGATTMNGTEKLRVNGNTEFDGKLTINGSNVLEATALTGSYNFNIQNTNHTNNGTLNLMGVNAAGATNLLTIRNDTTLPKMTFPSGIWTNNYSTNITDTELFYLDGVSSNIQTQLNSLSNSVSTNTANIGTNTSNISSLTSSVSTNTSDISSLTGQQTSNTNAINVNTGNISTNTGAISSLQGQQNTNTLNISSLTSQQSTNTSNISTNSTAISDIKTKYDFTGSVSNGKLLIGNSSNYSVGELLSSDNSVTITKSAGGIDLVVPSSSSLSAGTGINITANAINYDINKETAYTSPNSGDLMLLYDSVGNATKKITFQDFNAGLQTQITSNDSDITTNTGNISTNTTGITNIKNKYDFSTTVLDGKLLIGSTSTNNYSSAYLTSTGNTITITNGSNSINLESNHTNLSAGVAIAINSSNIDLDINKENAFTSPIGNDLLIMYDTTNGATKKITFNNFNAGLQAQITSNDTDITNLTSSVSTNTSNISSLTSQQSTNTSNISTNTSNISSLTSQQSTNTSNISTNTSNISTNTSNISTNTSDITNIKNKYDFSTTVTDGKLLIGSTSGNDYNSANLTSSGGTITITNGSNSINLESNHTALTAGEGIALNSNAIDIDISKQTAITTPASDDLYILEDNGGNIKKITYNNLTSSLSTSTATNFGTSATGTVILCNSSQDLDLNSASMDSISSGKIFFRSNIASGLGFQIQGYNGSSYSSAFEVHNVSSGFPYLNLLLSNGFSINQYTGQSRNLIVDTNGKLSISNDMPITLTAGEGIALNANAIDVDISKQVAITTPANDDVLLLERNTGVINKIAYSDLGIGVTAGNAIAVSGTTVNVEISKENTITTPASGDLLLLEQASDGVLKNITYSNLVSGVDVTTATSIATAATGAVTVGNANNQTMNLVGSTINVNGNAKTKFRSTISTGTGFEVEGYNSADSIYYSSLKLDNSNVAGVRPAIEILGASGFYGGVGQALTIDANGKIDWITPSTTGTVLEQYNTTTDLLNSVQTSGKMALVKNPLKLWVYANLSTGLVWRSLSFDTATNLSLNTSTYELNSGGSTSFSSGDVITASTTGDIVKITVKVNDDLNPTVVNSLTSSTQTALDGWDGSSVVSMANAFSITDNADGTYTYEGQVKTKNETDTTAISYTITDINSSTILTFNYSIQNSNPTGFGTGSPATGGYYAVFSVGAGLYFAQTSTNYNLGFIGGNTQIDYYCNAGSFTNSSTPTNTSNNNPMIFHYTTRTYNSQNITVFYATTYNGSAGSYTAYSNRHFAVGFNTSNLTFVSAGNDEYYMYSGTYQMSNSAVYGSNRIGFAPSQNTTFTNNDAKWKFYKVA